MESWKSRAKAGASPESKAAVLRLYAGISSEPVALCTFMFFSNLWTPFQSILMFCIVRMSLLPVSGMQEISGHFGEIKWQSSDFPRLVQYLDALRRENEISKVILYALHIYPRPEINPSAARLGTMV